MFTPQEAINRLCDKREIFYDEMVDLMRQVMEGKVSPVQLSAILMGLHVKTESVSEIAAAASVMREFSTKVDAGPLENAGPQEQFLKLMFGISNDIGPCFYGFWSPG